MRMWFLEEKNTLTVFRLLAVIFTGLAVIGGINTYSPVPTGDMWNGYLGFFTQVSDGDLAAWWSQHNEHRIVLARILFWIDLSWFHGSVWFLIITNFLLMGIAYLVFSAILKEQLSKETGTFSLKLLRLLTLIILFSWIQQGNFTWGFQSQFILAQLLPLTAFFLLYRAFTGSPYSSGLFSLACLTGVMSVGSMANGILTLPLMALFALVSRVSWRRIAVLALLAIITTTAYFYDYHSVDQHGSIKDALLNNPIGLGQYLLLYIGGPFYYLTGKGSQAIAQLAGLFLIASATFFAWKTIKKPSSSYLQLAMLFFLLYIGGTALGTAGGRLIFGIEQALSSRYQTPALMAWVALLILYAPAISRGIKNTPSRTLIPLVLIPLLLLPPQLKAFRSQQNMLFERWVAALTLELEIKDQQQISSIFPYAEWALSLATTPVQQDLSIFGHPLIKNASHLIGQSVQDHSAEQCRGSLDEIYNVDGEFQYVKIRGWVFHHDSDSVPKLIHLLNEERKIIGYAITGQPRLDVETITPGAINSGFMGYMLGDQAEQPVTLKGYNPKCELQLATTPLVPTYTAIEAQLGKSIISARQDHIVDKNEWIGSDFYKTKIDGYKVFGSFINNDQDTGSISLELQRGDSLYYRSGPTGGNQLLSIKSEKLPYQVLPVAENWVVIEFSGLKLPKSFTVNLKDAGTSWGEWSAIAIKN